MSLFIKFILHEKHDIRTHKTQENVSKLTAEEWETYWYDAVGCELYHLPILHLRNSFLTVTSSAATGLGHAWYLSLSTIQRDDIDETTSISTFKLGMSQTVAYIGTGNVYSFLMRASASYSELMAELGYTDVQERERERERERESSENSSVLCSGDYCLVVDLWWFRAVSVANSGNDGNLTAHRYIIQVLRPVLLPFLQHQPRLLFRQENARPYTARVVQQFFAANNINVLPWPARSPDLSPIEQLWDHLGQRIRRRPNPPMNRDQLVQALR